MQDIGEESRIKKMGHLVALSREFLLLQIELR